MALELRIPMEIQDGNHQPFSFECIDCYYVRNQLRSHILSEIDLLLELFFLQVAIELQKSMEIQDGYHQPFCF